MLGSSAVSRRSEPTRRACLAGLASLFAAFTPLAVRADGLCRDDTNGPERSSRPGKPLGEINHNVLWGVALGPPETDDANLISAIMAEKPRLIVIGSGLKFGNLHPQSMQFEWLSEGTKHNTWDACDDIVSLAIAHGIPVRGDCLAWNSWLPGWITEMARGQRSDRQTILRGCFDRHFETVFERIHDLERGAGRQLMPWCSPVNEPFNPWVVRAGKPDWHRGPWLDAFGVAEDGVPGYIHRAFELADRFGGSSRPALFINETSCETDHYGPLLRPAMLDLVDALRRAGRRIDAVGLECHLMPQWMSQPRQPDWRPFVGFLKDLSARGLEIYLTELDVNDCSLRDRASRDRLVADYLRSFLAAALDVPAVKMVTNWNFSDKYSWLREVGSDATISSTLGSWASCIAEPPCPRPDLYDQAMLPKPARQALSEALARAL